MESNEDAEENTLIAAALQTQQEELANEGLSSPELDTYLREVAASLPENANAEPPVQFVTTATPTVIAPASVSTEEVTENCPPKCGKINGNNSNNGNSGSGNNNAGGNGGNDDTPNGNSDNNGGGQDKKDK